MISIKDIQLKKSQQGQCNDSSLEIRDGRFHTSPLMHKLCGSIADVPTVIQAPGPNIWIR